MKLTDLQQAEKALTKAYRWRTRRYRVNSFGTRTGAGNCLNEENMAREITDLEDRVEQLGGDLRRCLEIARGD